MPGGATPDCIARLLRDRFRHVRTGTTEPDLDSVLDAVVQVVGLDVVWWKQFWMGIPVGREMPLRFALCRAIGSALGADALMYVLESVSDAEQVSPGIVLATMTEGHALQDVAPPQGFSVAQLLPANLRMRSIMLTAVPRTQHWPMTGSPALSSKEARQLLSQYDAAPLDLANPLDAMWRLNFHARRLELQGPDIAIGAIEAEFQGGVPETDVAHAHFRNALNWLSGLESLAELPGVAAQGSRLQDALSVALQRTDDRAVAALIRSLSTGGALHPSAGVARERMMSLLGRERIERLPQDVRSLLVE